MADIRKTTAGYFTRPVVQLLARAHIAPNAVTWVGFLLSMVAAGLVGIGQPLAGGLAVLVAGFFDMLDGALARHTNQTSRFGGILDSTLDRLAEAALMISLMVFYIREPSATGVLLAGLALTGSLMVSYVRARAEAAGLECKVGFLTRAERVIIMALGLLLSWLSYALLAALAIVALFSFITAGQRLFEAWRRTRSG